MGEVDKRIKLERKQLLDYANPTKCSWNWRGLFKHRKYARRLITYHIADGKNTSLWNDLWCGPVPLAEREEAISYIQLPPEARVSDR